LGRGSPQQQRIFSLLLQITTVPTGLLVVLVGCAFSNCLA